MDSPYRSSPSPNVAQRPRDAGIAGEIVDQFADPMAFYRELVQNSIDAGTESIEVFIRYDAPQEVVRVSISDRGEGMSRAVIEDALLVLFRSTKEDQQDKIGKFGIGFASVLSIKPAIVRVLTAHEGIRHTLHLYPDLSYELFESGPATQSGTSVHLEIPMLPNAREEFARASEEALVRWCRHATVPITLQANEDTEQSLRSVRIDRPLALPGALASVKGTSFDRLTTAVVGLREGAYSAFFNHGLMLYETDTALVEDLSFVVQDSRLGHTLSRDNVRHDKHYKHALDVVSKLGESLATEVVRSMEEALLAPTSPRYAQLATAAHEAQTAIDRSVWPLPLTDRLASSPMISLRRWQERGGWSANKPSPLSAALARCQIPVVDRARATHDESTELSSWFAAHCGPVRDIADELTLVQPIKLTPSDLVLLDALTDLLDVGYRRPERIYIAELHGAMQNELTITGEAAGSFATVDADHWIVDLEGAQRNPFRPLRRPALILNAKTPQVLGARMRALRDADVAAQALARLILLDREHLSAASSDRLLQHGLERLFKGQL